MTLPLPIQLEIGQKLAGGVPDWSAPATVASVTKWSQTIVDRGGYESATATLDDQVTLLDEAAALAWLDPANLMRPIRAKARSDGHVVWAGVLTGVRATINGKTFSIDLADMANRLVVRYQVAGSNAQKASTALDDAASIAAYGRKDRVLSLDGTTDAGAVQRAQTGLNQIAYPQSRESSDAAYDVLLAPELYHRSVSVELQCMGVYGLLGNVTYSTTSTTMTATSTQVAALLVAYAGVNAYFDAGATSIVATGVSETEHADDDTTYLAKIEKLLTLGNSSHQRLAWGFDASGFVVAVSARANPTTLHYHEYTRTGLITDTVGAPIAPWDVQPNRMAQIVDVTAAAPPSGAIDGPTRKYIARVRCEVSESSAKASLEPDNDDPLDALLAHPVGNPTTDAGGRTSAIASTVAQLIKPIASPTNGTVDLGGGSIDTGGGSIDTGGGSIDTGGGTVTNPPGDDVDLSNLAPKPPPGTSYPKTAGGTPPQLAKWTAADTLGDSGMAVNVAGATNGQSLIYNSTSNLWVPGLPSVTGAVSGTTNQLAMFTSPTAVGNSGIAVTAGHDGGTIAFWDLGSSVQFEVYGRVSLVGLGTGGTLTFASGAGLRVDAFLEIDPTGATNNQALVYNLAADKWVPGSVGSLIGSGTPGRVTQWAASGTALEDSTLIKSGAGVLTIAAASTQTLTIAGSAGGTLALAGFTLTLDGSLRASGTGAVTGQVLRFNGTAFVPATTAAGLLGSGTTGRITQWAAGGATLEDSTLVKTGAGILTLSAASTYTLTAAQSGTLPVGTGTGGQIVQWNSTNIIEASTLKKAGAGQLILSAASAFQLDVNAGGSVVVGTGTGSYIAQWNSTNVLEASTLKKTGVGELLLTAAASYQLDAVASGAVVVGSGSVGLMAVWDTANKVSYATLAKIGSNLLTLDATGAYTLTALASGNIMVGNGSANQIAVFSAVSTVAGYSGLSWNDTTTTLNVQGTIAATSSTAGLDLYDRGGGSGLWSLYVSSGILRLWSSGDIYRYTGNSFYPVIASVDLGQSGQRWDIVYCNHIQTNAGVSWDLGNYSGGAGVATGEVAVTIGGTTYYLQART